MANSKASCKCLSFSRDEHFSRKLYRHYIMEEWDQRLLSQQQWIERSLEYGEVTIAFQLFQIYS